MIQLSNGEWRCVATISPGNTNSCLAVYVSTDACRTWSLQSRLNENGRTVDNGELVELSNGTLLLTMRSLVAGHSYRLPVYRSTDQGRSWDYLSNIDASEGNGRHGLWEPDFQVLADGRLAAFYSNEKHPGYSQIISEKVSTDDGATWGKELRIVCQAGGGNLRPGMPQITQMKNGQYMLVYEIVNLGNADVYYQLSADGVTWPGNLGTRIPCQHAGPFVESLPDGRVLVTSCQNEISISEDFGATWEKVTPAPWDLGFRFTWPALYVIGTNEVAALVSYHGVNLRFGVLSLPRAWPIPFIEDFNEGTDANWTRYDGNFAVSDGCYWLNDTNISGKALAGDASWSDGTLEADVMLSTPGNAGLVFRMTNPGDSGPDDGFGYYLGLDTSGHVTFGKQDRARHELESAELRVSTNTWHHVKVEMRGSHFDVYVDDMNHSKMSLEDDTFGKGQIGVRAFRCNARFDNVRFGKGLSTPLSENFQMRR